MIGCLAIQSPSSYKTTKSLIHNVLTYSQGPYIEVGWTQKEMGNQEEVPMKRVTIKPWAYPIAGLEMIQYFVTLTSYDCTISYPILREHEESREYPHLWWVYSRAMPENSQSNIHLRCQHSRNSQMDQAAGVCSHVRETMCLYRRHSIECEYTCKREIFIPIRRLVCKPLIG